MKFVIEGQEYEWDPKLSVAEAMFIQEKTGLGLGPFLRGIGLAGPGHETDAGAIAGMMWTLKKRAGEAVQWSDILNLNLFSFNVIPDAPAKPDEDKAPAKATSADPTSRGRTRKAAT